MGTNKNVVRDGFLLSAEPFERESIVCIESQVKAFYQSANAILRIERRSNELVMLQLLEMHYILHYILHFCIDLRNGGD